MISLAVILLLFGVYLLFLWITHLTKYKTVSAGDAGSSFASTIKLPEDIYHKNWIFDGVPVNPADYDVYVVKGNSMSISKIYDENYVLVDRLSDEKKFNVRKDNVLLLEIDRNKDIIREKKDRKVEFKLRKLIAYINSSEELEKCLKENENLVKTEKNRELIREKYEQCVEKYKQNNIDTEKIELIFSSTLDVKTNRLTYSFHPVKFLTGVVKYVIRND